MWRRRAASAILWTCVFSEALFAQSSAKVDFGRDVQPILKENCVGCHGPSQQMNGYRLDRRSSAFKVGTGGTNLAPGNSTGSRVYLKLIGNQYGAQMPPAGALRPEQIKIIKDWIDQGAEWPDALAGESATSLPASTPLMSAALYGDLDAMRRLLESGADANARNQAGATALMWAVANAGKVRLLLDHGADANAVSDEGRTPLIIATGRFGSASVVKLLLDHGANPSARAVNGDTPIQLAARVGDEEVLRMLVARGSDLKTVGPVPLAFSFQSDCTRCFEMLMESAAPDTIKQALAIGAPVADAHAFKALLDRGADVNVKLSIGNTYYDGRTPLMLAASSELIPVDGVKALIERGADINAKSAAGETALEFARRNGDTAVTQLLVKAGAKDSVASRIPIPKPAPAESIRIALQRSIPLLQRSGVTFIQKSGCVSCHNNSLTAMTVATARKNKLPVDDRIARSQLKTIASFIDGWRDRLLQGVGIPGNSDTVSYILAGMAAENYQPDAATGAMAYYLKGQQASDGKWRIGGRGPTRRPPIEASDITVTATSIRSLQVYAPKPLRAEYDKAVQLAASWLMRAEPKTTEERTMQLLGLAWAGVKPNNDTVRKAARSLLSEQRSDGGWGQLSSLGSDAYATGQALVALKRNGSLRVSDAAYKRAVQFLLSTQLEDGSWYVKGRALKIQPYFESGFPHGHDQWISAAGTNWASMALALAAH